MFLGEPARAPRHRSRRRGAGPPPGLRPDDPRDLDRRRRRHHDRPGQHASLRAAHQRGARRGRALRPHRDGHRPDAVDAGFSAALVEDLAIEQGPRRDWLGVKVFVRQAATGVSSASKAMSRLTRRRSGKTMLVDIRDVVGCTSSWAPRAPNACLRPTTTSRSPTSPRSSTTSTQAARRGRGCARRRAPRRRPGGAARGRPGRDPRRPRQRPGGRRARKRWSPTTPPTCSPTCRRAGRAAAPAHGARRGRAAATPSRLRREHRWRHDDDRAGHPRPRGDHRRGPRDGAARGARARPRLHGLRLPSAPRAPTGRYLGLVHIQRLLREPRTPRSGRSSTRRSSQWARATPSRR